VALPDLLMVSRPNVLVVDVGVKRLAADWEYDVVSIGYPGICVHGRPIAEPHNVVVDDKLRILTAVKAVWGGRVTTVFPRQGHYAHAAEVAASPPADLTIARIGELLRYDLSALLEAARKTEEA